MQRRLIDVLIRVGLAFAIVSAATLISVALRRSGWDPAPRITPFVFLAAVLTASWIGGYAGAIGSVVFGLGITVFLGRAPVDPYRSTLLLFLAIAVAWIVSHRRHVENRLRQLVDEKTAELQTAVENLEREVHERRAVEDEVRRLNHLLERRVDDRTRQLEVSNQELASFSYSVSHDLRAPLRSIDGFSRILLDSCQGRFDENEKALFERILAATARMSQLIEDLLNLARVARIPMAASTVDLSEMAGRIAADFKRDHPESATEFIIHPGLSATCDSSLVEVVLTNLIENGWKFSSHTTHPCVEFGSTAISGEPVFFVRDNGAGFDPAYKSKLFAPFQRLHRQEEFPGTGIGLATVSRIVHRHGGWITAESQPGKGATFFFTLQCSRLDLLPEAHLPEEPNPPVPLAELPSSSSSQSTLM